MSNQFAGATRDKGRIEAGPPAARRPTGQPDGRLPL